MEKLTILLASGNPNKVREIKAIMADAFPAREIEVLSLKDIGFEGDIVEDGDTFEANALIKAKAIAGRGYITMADDSGLMVDALGGEPGVYSARYAGEPCDNEANNDKLLQNLADVPAEARTAKFVSVVACSFPDGREIVTRGECPGMILFERTGNGGFGYDPLFYYEPLQKTFAQLTPEEKNSISHRARAMAAFTEQFKKAIEE